MHKVKTIVFLVVLAALALPVFQLRYSIFSEWLLKGYELPSAPPELKYFTWQRWFSQDFQQVFTTRLNEHTGFRNTLIRIRNQYDYTCFGITHAEGFLEGKDGYFFEEDYIHEYTGKYFIGTKAIDKKLSRLKNVMDSLASYNIPLILVFESGKGSFYPEYIPDRFHPEKRTQSNYDYFVARSTEIGLPFLDINHYFLEMKDTSVYPLFPKYGMHWSLFGVRLVADTLSKLIARATGRTMPTFKVHHLHQSDKSLGFDYDIGDMLNLIFPLKHTPGAYPIVSMDSIPNGKLSALVVADSYYIMLVESYGKKMFGKQDFWYYNSSVYPHQNEIPPVKVDKTGLREKLKQHDVILLMVSETNLHCCFWGFADEAYSAFHPEIKDSQLEGIENSIRIDREWFRFMVRKSEEQKKPLDEVIRSDAEYAFLSNYQNLEGKGYQDTIQFFKLNLSYNPEWVARMTKKAMQLNIPVDSVMVREAVDSYNQSKKKQ
ncbi:MAG: hypothetical protein NT004_08675 [Bacteroidetes bacterium]|nr:hypothetical protein [Bacteroidota bacterium]